VCVVAKQNNFRFALKKPPLRTRSRIGSISASQGEEAIEVKY